MANPLKTFLMPELIKGLSVTARTFFTRKYTLNYPEEKTPQSPRFPVTGMTRSCGSAGRC